MSKEKQDNEKTVRRLKLANEAYGDGWLKGAALAITGSGFEWVGVDEVLFVPALGFVAVILYRKRRGPFSDGRKRKWWALPPAD